MIGLTLAAFLFSAAGSQPPEPKQEMIPVSYDNLKQEILKHRGKVVLVDFWAGY
jgi:thioredoxin-like negative regulator of GroEL